MSVKFEQMRHQLPILHIQCENTGHGGVSVPGDPAVSPIDPVNPKNS